MTPVARCRSGLMVAIMLAASAPAAGTQHLVSPGSPWQDVAERARPGDRIILMPGRHRTASFNGLQGAPGKPIRIGGLDPSNPAMIRAGREGLRFQQPQHLVLENLVITGATISGLVINGGRGQGETREPWPAHVTLRNVTVQRTGPHGQRHALDLAGLGNLQIEDCHVEGWGGAGINIVGCHTVAISNCTIKGLADHSQSVGIMVRGGSTGVRITDCVIEGATEHSVSIGGRTGIADFWPMIPDDAPHGARVEASDVQVLRCVLVGSECPVAFVSCDDARVSYTTIVRPRRWVACMLDKHDDPRVATSRSAVLGSSLIVWEPGDLEQAVHIGEGIDPKPLFIEANLWWSPEPPAQLEQLLALPDIRHRTQISNVDPKLDEQFRPTEKMAFGFGAHRFQGATQADAR
ncbi:MAG: right-handed parallel beta-helix repeat-containing protein [Planctomycetota bacterium]